MAKSLLGVNLTIAINHFLAHIFWITEDLLAASAIIRAAFAATLTIPGATKGAWTRTRVCRNRLIHDLRPDVTVGHGSLNHADSYKRHR